MFGVWAEKTSEPHAITLSEINFQLKSSHLFSILGPLAQKELYSTKTKYKWHYLCPL